MIFKINKQAPLFLISLTEAKQQCRLMDSFYLDDELLNDQILTASTLAQAYCNRLLAPANVTTFFDIYQAEFTLWGGEITAVSSVTATNLKGELVTITDYHFSPSRQSIMLPRECVIYSDFAINCEGGFLETPPQVKTAVKMLVSTLYNNRDDFVTGLTVEKLPLTSMNILNTVKHYVS